MGVQSRLVVQNNVWETPAQVPATQLVKLWRGQALAAQDNWHNGQSVDLLAALRQANPGATLGADVAQRGAEVPERFWTDWSGTPPVQRQAFKFGHQKINLHVRGREFEPKAHLPVPGALDLCFIASVPLDEVMARVAQADWPIVEGPVLRTGATQKIRSIYLRDPDLNLIEISELV